MEPGQQPYWCPFCCRAVEGEEVADDDGETVATVYVHDDVPHPVEVAFDEEDRPQ